MASGNTTGRILWKLHEPGVEALSFTSSFTTTSTGWTTVTRDISTDVKTAALAAQARPVSVTLTVETSQPLRIDELRFGDLICARCNPALSEVRLRGDLVPPSLPGNSTPTDVAFRVPQGLGMGSIALGADGELKVIWGAKVHGMADGIFGTITNVGSVGTTVGFETIVGDVHSVAPLLVRGAIQGNLVHQGGVQILGGGTIAGSNTQSTISTSEMRWTAHLPKPGNTNLDFSSGAKALPLETTTVNVQGGTLVIGSGAHVVSTLRVQPLGSVLVDNSAGDVYVYVRSTVDIQGPIMLTDPTRNNAVFVYLGTSDFVLKNDFRGTIVAPKARVVFDAVGQPYFGSVFAQNIELRQDNLFHYQHYYPECQADAIHVCGTSKPGCIELKGCEAQQCEPDSTFAAGTEATCYETAKAPVWGFADLHAHPATELGFGATDSEPGVFVGSTGFDLVGPFPELTCVHDKHSLSTFDARQHITRKTLVSELEKPGNFAHTPHGTGGLGVWPSARSVLHQQMRIDWIRRAFDGGLRLMFAAVTDIRLLSTLWSGSGWGITSAGLPAPSPTNTEWDVTHAERQLDHIEAVVAANSSWMEIVDSPASARAAIQNGKLAVVLSLEMDALDVESILALKSAHKIGHVIPIHLADNPWGGTAVYNELFEANSWFLNQGTPIQLAHDPSLTFHLPRRTTVASAANVAWAVHSQLSEADACNPARHGHKNALGLTSKGKRDMEALMEAGLFIDVSHMSDSATDDTIGVLTHPKFDYPVMSSHTGIRKVEGVLSHTEKSARGPEVSERSLSIDQARKIGESGGVIGVGTAGGGPERVLADVMGGEIAHVGSAEVPTWRWDLLHRRLWPESNVVQTLKVTLRAGYDGKRACNEVQAHVRLRSGQTRSFTIFENQEIAPYASASSATLTLTNNVTLRDIVGVELEFDALENCPGSSGFDSFAVLDLKVSWSGPDETGGPLVQRTASVESQGARNGYYVLLGAANPRHLETLHWSEDERFFSEKLLRLRVRYTTPYPQPVAPAKFAVETTDRCFSPQPELTPYPPPPPSDHWESVFDFTTAQQSNGSPFTVADVLKVVLRDTGSNIDFLAIEADTVSGTHELVNHRGRPFIAGGRTNTALYEAVDRCKGVSLDESSHSLLVHLTAGDGVPHGDDPVRIRICWAGDVCHEIPLNPSAPWAVENGELLGIPVTFLSPGQTVTVAIHGHSEASVRELERVEIISTHPWDIDRIRVTIPDDPLVTWSDNYRSILSAMNGRGVALGTDLNGFQHQLAFSRISPGYPFSVPGPSGAPVATLDKSTIGERVLELPKDGLAHYGMLADMAAAVPSLPNGPDTFDRLFRSAEDTIRMWERIEERKAVLVQRRDATCSAFGLANQAKSVSGVSCLTLPPGPAPALELRVTSDPAGTLEGEGALDLHITDCVGTRYTVSLTELNQWRPMFVLPWCSLRLGVQGEPGDSYELMYRFK